MSDKTIAQQLKIKQFPFVIKDDNGNLVYHEDSDGYWWKLQYDDANNLVYHEDSYGYWCKKEFDDANNVVYYEDSSGYISDKRPKSKAMAKVAEARKLLEQAEKEFKIEQNKWRIK